MHQQPHKSRAEFRTQQLRPSSRYAARYDQRKVKALDGVMHAIPSRPAPRRHANAPQQPALVSQPLNKVTPTPPASVAVQPSSKPRRHPGIANVSGSGSNTPPKVHSQKAPNQQARQPSRTQVLQRSTVQKPFHSKSNSRLQKKKRNKPVRSLRFKRPAVRLRYVLTGLVLLLSFGLLGSLAAYVTNGGASQANSGEVLSSNSPEVVAQVEAPAAEHVREDPVTGADIAAHAVDDDKPRAIFINDIDVSARIKQAAVTMGNRIELPPNVADVAWYEGSRKPGERGVVLLNSYVSGPNERGAFYYLRALEPGDIIELETGDGTRYEYEVRSRERIPYREMNTFSLLVPYEPGANGLNLVAVDDRFNVMSNDYQDRLVVYAVQL